MLCEKYLYKNVCQKAVNLSSQNYAINLIDIRSVPVEEISILFNREKKHFVADYPGVEKDTSFTQISFLATNLFFNCLHIKPEQRLKIFTHISCTWMLQILRNVLMHCCVCIEQSGALYLKTSQKSKKLER